MAWEFRVMMVANLTAGSEELLAALRDRAEGGACRFTLVIPHERPGAVGALNDAIEGMQAAGLEKVVRAASAIATRSWR